ncbi:hypothetical protein EJB05_16921, partial [Eragrostis curvula]
PFDASIHATRATRSPRPGHHPHAARAAALTQAAHRTAHHPALAVALVEWRRGGLLLTDPFSLPLCLRALASSLSPFPAAHANSPSRALRLPSALARVHLSPVSRRCGRIARWRRGRRPTSGSTWPRRSARRAPSGTRAPCPSYGSSGPASPRASARAARCRRRRRGIPLLSLARPEDIGGSPYHDALGPEVLRCVAADDSWRTGASPRKEKEEEEEVPAPAAQAWEEARQQDAVLAPAVAQRKQDGDGDGAEDEEWFSDALDTLSRTESLTMNCSVSGLSGALDRAPGADPGARGFMMDRFLPAAHAVAVGSPQYTFRKAGAAAGATGNSGREHARAAAVKAGTGNGDDRTRRAPEQLPQQHLPPNYLSCSYPRRLEHDEEEEDDDDDYDVHSTRGFSAKGCGLLPGLCVKTSLMLLNPVPAMKRGKAQGRGRGHQFASKRQSPLARSSQNKPMGCDSNGQSWEDVYKHKLEQKYLGQGEDLRSKLTSESNQLTVLERFADRGWFFTIPPLHCWWHVSISQLFCDVTVK